MRIDNQHYNFSQPIKSEPVKPIRNNENKEKQAGSNARPEKDVKEINIAQEVEFIDKALKVTNSHLQFSFHEKSGRYQIKIVEDGTSEVIKEIPAESVLEISAMIKEKLDEMVGLLVDKII